MTHTIRATIVSSVCFAVLIALAAGIAHAQVERDDATLQTPGVDRELTLPDHAANADVISLGTAIDPESGEVVEGYAYFHHREGHDGGPSGGGGGNPGGGNDDGGDDSTTSSCYAYFDKHTYWNVVEDYMIDPTNTRGLDESYIISTIGQSMSDWEDAADTAVFGTEIANAVDGADSTSPDGKNEVMFGSIDSPGAIAVTIVWGTFSGPPHNRKLTEWDQVYDQVDYDWSENGEDGAMDFWNIAAHELGHAVGLTHPDSTCTEETMHATAGFGETKKRSLHIGDITGVNNLY